MKNNFNSSNRKTSGFAIASFILGLIPLIQLIFPRVVPIVFESIYPSIFLFDLPILSSIAFGITFLIKIRKDTALKGKEFAIAGITLSILTILIEIISFILLARSLSQW